MIRVARVLTAGVFGRAAASLLVLICLGACNSKSGTTAQSPTAPTSPLAAPAAPRFAQIQDLDLARQRLSLSWDRISGAESYVIEAGSSSGSSDLVTFSVSASTNVATWADVPPRDEIYLRVKAANAAGVSAPTAEVRVPMPDMRNVIEALFLGSGPFSIGAGIGDVQRNPAQRMSGWPPGSQVSVRVPHEVAGEQLDAVVQSLDQLNAAMGAVNFFVERATLTLAQWNQLLPPGITILVGQGQCSRADGSSADCSLSSPTPVFARSQIRMTSSIERANVWVHELGHSAGLRHIWLPVRVGGSTNQYVPVASFGRYSPVMGGMSVSYDNGDSLAPNRLSNLFSELELEAIRRVYGSGLRPGSTVADFIGRDLITP